MLRYVALTCCDRLARAFSQALFNFTVNKPIHGCQLTDTASERVNPSSDSRESLNMSPVNRAGAVSEISPLLAGENSRPPAPSRETPLGPGAKKDGCYASPHFPS